MWSDKDQIDLANNNIQHQLQNRTSEILYFEEIENEIENENMPDYDTKMDEDSIYT